jgi:glucose/arabinose dehydrogenase
MRSILVALLISGLSLTSASASPRRRPAPRLPTFCSLGSDVPGVTVPDGFCVRKFADVHTPRVLAFAPNGDLFVSSPQTLTPGGAHPGDAAIYVFRQPDLTLPPVRSTYAIGSSFESVHGLAFTADSLLYSVTNAVEAVPYIRGDTTLRSGQRRIVDMSDSDASSRWTHTIAVDTNGSIYVSRGQFDNDGACAKPKPRNGAILEASDAEPQGHLVTTGFRDPLYMRCMPWGACYAVELTGDGFDPKLGAAEKLIEVHETDNFGYPCCYGLNVPNPDLAFLDPPLIPDCSKVAVERQTFPLHDTPFGFDWERHNGWPVPYEGAFFVGLHGQFSLWTNAGLQWAPADPTTHLPMGPTQPFLQGVGHFKSIKRVADVVFAPDGRLFFSDDQGEESSAMQGGAIYWIAPKTLVRPLAGH